MNEPTIYRYQPGTDYFSGYIWVYGSSLRAMARHEYTLVGGDVVIKTTKQLEHQEGHSHRIHQWEVTWVFYKTESWAVSSSSAHKPHGPRHRSPLRLFDLVWGDWANGRCMKGMVGQKKEWSRIWWSVGWCWIEVEVQWKSPPSPNPFPAPAMLITRYAERSHSSSSKSTTPPPSNLYCQLYQPSGCSTSS